MLRLAEGFKFEKITEMQIIHHVILSFSGVLISYSLVRLGQCFGGKDSIFSVKSYTRYIDIDSPKR